MNTEIKVPVRLEVLLDSVTDLKNTISNLKPDSTSWQLLLKILRTVNTEINSISVATGKAFSSLKDFNNTEKSIRKIEDAFSLAKLIMSRIDFNDIKLTEGLSGLLKEFERLLNEIEAKARQFKATMKLELLDSNAWSAITEIDANAVTHSYDEILKEVEKKVKLLTEQLKKALEALTLATNDRARADTMVSFFQDLWKEFFKSNWTFKAGGHDKLVKWAEENLLLTPELLAGIKEKNGALLREWLQGFDINLLTKNATKAKNTQNTRLTELNNILQLQKNAQMALEAFRATLEKIANNKTSTVEDRLRIVQAENEYRAAIEKTILELSRAAAAEASRTQAINQLKFALSLANKEYMKMQRASNTISGIRNAVVNFMGFNLVLNLTKRAVKLAANHIKELDSVMNKISVVTNMTTSDLWNLIDAYSDMALSYGVSIKGAYEVSLIYYQLGLETNQVLTLTNETLKLAKISGLSYASTTDYMTTALRGFKMEMEEASTVVDVYSALAAHTAVSLEELAVAMSKTASSMESIGSTFQETSAMIGTMVAVTRESATNIGSALKSIASRYGELTKDPLTLIDADGEVLAFNKVDTALLSVGISMKDTQGQFRDFTDVILELSDVWDLLDNTQLRYIATLFAGNRLQSRFLALVSNGDLLRLNIQTANDSEDTGAVLTLKTLDSIESKIEQVKVAYLQFYTSVGAENIWKSALDGTKNFINILNGLPKLFGKIPVGAIGMIANIIDVIHLFGDKIVDGIGKVWARVIENDELLTALNQLVQKMVLEGDAAADTLKDVGKKEGKAYNEGIAEGLADLHTSVSKATNAILLNTLRTDLTAAKQANNAIQSATGNLLSPITSAEIYAELFKNAISTGNIDFSNLSGASELITGLLSSIVKSSEEVKNVFNSMSAPDIGKFILPILEGFNVLPELAAEIALSVSEAFKSNLTLDEGAAEVKNILLSQNINWTDAGSEMRQSIIDTVTSAIKEVDGLSNEMLKVGNDIGISVALGILLSVGVSTSAALELGAAVLEALRTGINSHSPSPTIIAMFETGVGEAIQISFLTSAESVINSAKDFGFKITDALKSSLENGETIDLNKALLIDNLYSSDLVLKILDAEHRLVELKEYYSGAMAKSLFDADPEATKQYNELESHLKEIIQLEDELSKRRYGGELIANKMYAAHNFDPDFLLQLMSWGRLPGLSLALKGAGSETWTDFSRATMFFGKDTVDPKKSPTSVYRGDAYTPTLDPNMTYHTAKEALDYLNTLLARILRSTTLFQLLSDTKVLKSLDEVLADLGAGGKSNLFNKAERAKLINGLLLPLQEEMEKALDELYAGANPMARRRAFQTVGTNGFSFIEDSDRWYGGYSEEKKQQIYREGLMKELSTDSRAPKFNIDDPAYLKFANAAYNYVTKTEELIKSTTGTLMAEAKLGTPAYFSNIQGMLLPGSELSQDVLKQLSILGLDPGRIRYYDPDSDVGAPNSRERVFEEMVRSMPGISFSPQLLTLYTEQERLMQEAKSTNLTSTFGLNLKDAGIDLSAGIREELVPLIVDSLTKAVESTNTLLLLGNGSLQGNMLATSLISNLLSTFGATGTDAIAYSELILLQVLTNLGQKINESSLVGQDVANGYMHGMLEGLEGARAAGELLGIAGIDGLHTGAGAHSDSVKAAKTALDIINGLVHPIEGNLDKGRKAGEELGESVITGLLSKLSLDVYKILSEAFSRELTNGTDFAKSLPAETTNLRKLTGNQLITLAQRNLDYVKSNEGILEDKPKKPSSGSSLEKPTKQPDKLKEDIKKEVQGTEIPFKATVEKDGLIDSMKKAAEDVPPLKIKFTVEDIDKLILYLESLKNRGEGEKITGFGDFNNFARNFLSYDSKLKGLSYNSSAESIDERIKLLETAKASLMQQLDKDNSKQKIDEKEEKQERKRKQKEEKQEREEKQKEEKQEERKPKEDSDKKETINSIVQNENAATAAVEKHGELLKELYALLLKYETLVNKPGASENLITGDFTKDKQTLEDIIVLLERAAGMRMGNPSIPDLTLNLKELKITTDDVVTSTEGMTSALEKNAQSNTPRVLIGSSTGYTSLEEAMSAELEGYFELNNSSSSTSGEIFDLQSKIEYLKLILNLYSLILNAKNNGASEKEINDLEKLLQVAQTWAGIPKASLNDTIDELNRTRLAYDNLRQGAEQVKEANLDLANNAPMVAELHVSSIETIIAKIKLWHGALVLNKLQTNLGKSLSGLGSALPMLAGLFNKSDRAGQAFAGTLTAIGGALKLITAIGTANPFMAIAMGIISVVNGINMIIEDPKERLERLNKEADELNNKAKELKVNTKTLETSKKQLEELTEKRYESAEAAEEYLDAVDSLVEKFPELIIGFDSAGDAIIEMDNMERVLTKAREATAEATLKAAEAERVRQEELYNLSKLELVNAVGNLKASLAEFTPGNLLKFNFANEQLSEWYKNSSYFSEPSFIERPTESISSADLLTALAHDIYMGETIPEEIISAPLANAIKNYLESDEYLNNKSLYFETDPLKFAMGLYNQLDKSIEGIDFFAPTNELERTLQYTSGLKDYMDHHGGTEESAYSSLISELETAVNEDNFTKINEVLPLILELLNKSNIEVPETIETVFTNAKEKLSLLTNTNEALKMADKTILSAKINLDYNSDERSFFMTSDALNGLVQNKIVEEYENQEQYDKIEDYYKEVGKSTSNMVNQYWESLENKFINGENALEVLEKMLSDRKHYSATDIIKTLGLENGDEFSLFLIDAYDSRVKLIKKDVEENIIKQKKASKLETTKNSFDALLTYFTTLTDVTSIDLSFFGKIAGYTTDLDKEGIDTTTFVNLAMALYKALTGETEEVRNAILDAFLKNGIGTVSDVSLIILAGIAAGADAEAPDGAIQALEKLKGMIATNLNLSAQAGIDNFITTWGKDGSKFYSKLTSGFDFTEIDSVLDEAKRIGFTLTNKDLLLNGNKFVLSAEKTSGFVEQYAEFLGKQGSYSLELENRMRKLFGRIEVESSSDVNSKEYWQNNILTGRDNISEAYANRRLDVFDIAKSVGINIDKYIQDGELKVDEFTKALEEAYATTYDNVEHFDFIALMMVQAVEKSLKWDKGDYTSLATTDLENFKGKTNDQIRKYLFLLSTGAVEYTDKELETDEVKNAVASLEKEENKLVEKYTRRLTKLKEAMSQVEGINEGSMVTGITKEILLKLDMIDEKGVVKSTFDLVTAYEAIYDEMYKNNASTTTDLNDAAKKILNAKYKGILSTSSTLSKGIISYDELILMYEDNNKVFSLYGGKYKNKSVRQVALDFMSLAEEEGYIGLSALERAFELAKEAMAADLPENELQRLIDAKYIKQDELGNITITNFDAIAAEQGWTRGTKAYEAGYSAYIDALIALEDKYNADKIATNALKKLSSAKMGDTVNIHDLPSELKTALGLDENADKYLVLSEFALENMLLMANAADIDTPELKAALKEILDSIKLKRASGTATLGIMGLTATREAFRNYYLNAKGYLTADRWSDNFIDKLAARRGYTWDEDLLLYIANADAIVAADKEILDAIKAGKSDEYIKLLRLKRGELAAYFRKDEKRDALSNLLSNYKDAADYIDEFNTLFGQNLEGIEGLVTTVDGKRVINVDILKEKFPEIAENYLDLLNEWINTLADEYINNASKAVSLVSQGTTSKTEMDAFKKAYTDVMKTSNNQNPVANFMYDEIANAMVLDSKQLREFLKTSIANSQLELTPEQLEDWVNALIEAFTLDQLDFSNFISGTASEKDTKLLERTLQQTFELLLNKTTEDAKELVTSTMANIAQGGLTAIDAIKSTGKELSTEEIEAAYRAQIAPLSALADSLSTLEAGSVVAKNLISALTKAGFLVNADGVVTSTGDLVEAYRSIYIDMQNTNEATVSELNKVVGNILDNRDKQQGAIDTLSNATDMTYSQFVEIFSNAGIKVTERFIDNLESQGTIKSLGGNKMMISNFDALAKIMQNMGKWDIGSEEYINALSNYRDGLISYNKLLGDNIKANFDAISGAKVGDLINLTLLLSKFPKYEAELEATFGDIILNGILTVKDGLTLPQLAIAIGNKAVAEGGMLAEELEDFIASIHDNILNGITNAFSYSTSGINNIAGMQSFITEYNTLTGENLDYADAFDYDTSFNTFKLNNDIMKKYIAALKEQLEALGLSGEAIDEYIKDLTDTVLRLNIELDNFLNANTSKERNDEANKLITQISSLSNYRDIAIFASNITKEIEITKEQYDLAILHVLESGGKAAVDLLKQIKPDASLEELESAFNSLINKLNDVMSQVGDLVAGQFVGTEGKLYEVLSRASAVDSNGVVLAGFSMVDVYAAIYAEMTKTAGNTTAGLNDVYAELMAALDLTNIDITDALKNGNGMSYKAFGELLARYDIELKDYMEKSFGIIERDGFGNIRITDWEAFAKSIFKVEDLNAIKNTPEYVSAFKAYNDGLIELNKNTEKTIVDEVKLIEGAKTGDWLNLSLLWTSLQTIVNDALLNVTPEGYNGNADLANRPIVPAEKMKEIFAGFEGDYATLYSRSFMSSDFDDYTKNAGMLFTTITASGEIVEDLYSYVKALYDEAAGDVDRMHELDKVTNGGKGLMLFGEMTSSYERLGKYAEDLHDRGERKDTINYYLLLLRTFGASFEDGILKISDNANMLGVALSLRDLIDASGIEIGNGLAEIEDAITSVLKSYAEAITKGISGGLTNTEVNDLITKAKDFGITDLQFNETAEGFLLAETSAIKLYLALKSIDSLHAEEAFNALSESLLKTNENFKTTEALMAHITNIRNGTYAADDKISNARKELYEAELAVAEEILAVRSTTEDDSFNFMDLKIPSGLNNPLNYWKGWQKAFDAINESKKSKRMDYTNFYNLMTEMGNLSAMMGGQGIQIGKDLVVNSLNYTDLITLAAKNLTVTSKDTNLKVNLPAINVDFSSAKNMASDIDKGIQAMADEQINMLDGLIAILETVVAMEKLADITGGGEDDTIIDLGDIFPEIEWDENGNAKNLDAITAYDADYLKFLNWIETQRGKNKDLDNALKSLKVNGMSLSDIFGLSAHDLAAKGKEFNEAYVAFLEGMRKAALSGDYDIDNIMASVKEVLAESGINDLTIDTGKSTMIIKGGVITTIDWEDPDVNEVIKELTGKEKASEEEILAALNKIKSAMESYLSGKGTKELTLEQVLKINHRIKVDPNTKQEYVMVGTDRYNAGDPDWKGALAALLLLDMGIDSGDITVESDKAIVSNYTIGNKSDITITSKDGKVLYEGKNEYGSKITGSNELEWLQDWIKHYREDYSKKNNGEKLEWTDNEILWRTLNIHVNTKSLIIDKEGKNLDLTHDAETRKYLREAKASLTDNLTDYINNEGDVVIPLGNGLTWKISGKDIDLLTDGTYDLRKFEALFSLTMGIDEALKDTISSGVKDALSTLPDLLQSMTDVSADGLNEVAGAISTISDNAAKAENPLQKLVALLKELTAIQAKPTIEVPEANPPKDNTPKSKNSPLPLIPKETQKPVILEGTDKPINDLFDKVAAVAKKNVTEVNLSLANDFGKGLENSELSDKADKPLEDLGKKVDEESGKVGESGGQTLVDKFGNELSNLANQLTPAITSAAEGLKTASKTLGLAIVDGIVEGMNKFLTITLQIVPLLTTISGGLTLIGFAAVTLIPLLIVLETIAAKLTEIKENSDITINIQVADGAIGKLESIIAKLKELAELAGLNVPGGNNTPSNNPPKNNFPNNPSPLNPLGPNGQPIPEKSIRGINMPVTPMGGPAGLPSEGATVKVTKADTSAVDNGNTEINDATANVATANDDGAGKALVLEGALAEVTESTDAGAGKNLTIEGAQVDLSTVAQLVVKVPVEYENGEVPEPSVPDATGTVNWQNGSLPATPTFVATGIIHWVSAAFAAGTFHKYIERPKVDVDTKSIMKKDVLHSGSNTKSNNTHTKLRTETANAKGTIIGNALVGGTPTLMGELGPELVVSNGKYKVVGVEGPEMVPLSKDAIVFNHLLTKSLLTKGMSKERGRAVTNERNAVAFATGNIDGGPAMASASAALAALKQLRAMWESIKGASVQDLAGAGGGGGGGGGGDKAKIVDPRAWIDTVERWYNLMQEIAKLEQLITYQELIRTKLLSDWLANGKAYFSSLKKSLDALNAEVAAQEQLNISRQMYFNKRVDALKESPLGKLYTWDEESGTMKFRDDVNINGKQGAMAFLTDLVGFDDIKGANYTNEEKYNILKANGFASYMKYDSNGMEIKMDEDNDGEITDEERESFYEKATQAWWDKVNEFKEATESLHQAIEDGNVKIEELLTAINEELKAIRENLMEVEDAVLNAIEEARLREIDALQDLRDALEESVGKYIDGLSDALDKEREMYESEEAQDELNRNRRRLAILLRSGGSAADISALQDEIRTLERDLYFDAQLRQIDAILEASDKEIERLDNLIDIMTELLEYLKLYGLLWNDVYSVMDGSVEQIVAFISGETAAFWEKSPLANADEVNKTIFLAEYWKSYSDSVTNDMNLLATISRKQQEQKDYETFNKLMIAEVGAGYDASGKYKQMFLDEYTNNRMNLSEATKVVSDQYYADVERAKEAKRREEERKRLEEAKKAAAAPSGGGGGSGGSGGCSGCDSKCASWCYGSCGGACQNSCSGQCTGDCGKMTVHGAGSSLSSPRLRNTNGGKASGGFVSHGIYELGERGTETVLTALQTQVLRNNILSNRPSSLISLLKTYNEGFSRMDTPLTGEVSTDNSITIENMNMTMDVKQISNDYDARRAGEQAMNEMLRIARKTSAANSVRR